MAGFDIHVDATELAHDGEQFLIKEMGFWRSDFCGHPEGAEAYEPLHHLTIKPETGTEYKDSFNRVQQYFQSHRGSIKGYVEGEFFAFDKDLESKPFDECVKVPFAVKTGFLPPGTFRESEIHVTMSRDKSDPRLIRTLMDMGLFAAYLSKDYGVGQVFTVQGTQAQIQALLQPLFDFLNSIGGSVHCSVKEERVVGWWMSDPTLRLPPIAREIQWFQKPAQ
jgi:hypothetical protein